MTASTTTTLDATIAVFGASGLTAQECVYQALKDGDQVVGLTRNPSKLVIPKGSGGSDADKPLVDPNLTMIAGDVTNPVDVAKGKKLDTADDIFTIFYAYGDIPTFTQYMSLFVQMDQYLKMKLMALSLPSVAKPAMSVIPCSPLGPITSYRP